MKKVNVAILISGRGSNMKALIEACKNNDFPAQISLIISNKEDAAGLEFAKKNNIPTKFINHKSYNSREEFDKELTKTIEEYNCDLVCLAGFMRVLSSYFVDRWQNRLINIHPSLLPNFKGANAVEDALSAGATESGCSVHFVETQVDSGEIIMQEKVHVEKNDTKETLASRILEKEHIIYPLALKIVSKKLINNN